MARRHEFGGDPNNTSYRTTYSNNYLYSDYGGWPTGNPSSDGGAPVKLYGAGADWTTGATWTDVVYLGGSSFRIRVGHGSGSLGAGRNTGNGSSMVDSADGDTVAGGICGWFDWATVAGAPSMIQATPQPGGKILVQFGGSADDGGAGMTGWQLQVATNAAFTTGVQTMSSSGTTTFSGSSGTTYYFRARGANDVGWSAWSGALSATAKSGGKVRVGGAWKPAVVKVRVGGAWKDGIVKVRQGGVWKDAL